MNISLVVYGDPGQTSGGYLYDRQLVDHLVSRGNRVSMVSLPRRSYLLSLAAGVFGGRLEAETDIILVDELCHPSLFRRVRRSLRGGSPARPAPVVVAVVHHLRSSERHPGFLLPLYRAVERAFLRGADGFIFNSEATRRETFRLLGKNPPPSVVARPGGDRFPGLLSEDRVRERSQVNGPLRILFVGNLIPRKGLHILLEALAGLTSGPRDWTLRVVGNPAADPSYAWRVRRLAEKLEVSGPAGRGRIFFEGNLDNRYLEKLYRESHVLAVPSEYEGFGIVYLEAMRFGLVPIASSAGGAAEIISTGKDGYLVSPADTAEVRLALQELMEDREFLTRKSLAALRKAGELPGWKDSMETVRLFLREFSPEYPTGA